MSEEDKEIKTILDHKTRKRKLRQVAGCEEENKPTKPRNWLSLSL